jgi:hypothetical protein
MQAAKTKSNPTVQTPAERKSSAAMRSIRQLRAQAELWRQLPCQIGIDRWCCIRCDDYAESVQWSLQNGLRFLPASSLVTAWTKNKLVKD